MSDQNLPQLLGPLCHTITNIHDPTQMFNFLRDLCTEAELRAFAERRDIAQRLHAGESYKHIEQKTGASSTTIARVNKYLTGPYGGYRTSLNNN